MAKPHFKIPVKKSMDGLMNVYTGMGGSDTLAGNNEFRYSGFNNAFYLDLTYRESAIARKICDLKAQDAVRAGRTVSTENDADKIVQIETQFDLMSKVGLATSYSRAYGGAAILMITNQPLNEPLDVTKVKKGDLKKLIVFDCFDLMGSTMNVTNPLADSYMQPEYYTISGSGGLIHNSHFARFLGAELPRRLIAENQGWGDSELRRVMDDMKDTIGMQRGVAELVQKANLDIITRDGLAEALSTDQDKNIIERYRIFSLMASNFGISLLDGSEALSRQSLNMSGIAPVQEQMFTWLSAVSDYPVTKLFGTSAKGMNATGDGDMSNYYDAVSSIQEFKIRPPMSYIDEVLVRSALGDMPEDYSFTFNPLEQMNETDQATALYNNSQADATYRDMLGAALPKSVIMQKLQASESYNITSQMIEDQQAEENAGNEGDDFGAA